MFVPVRGMGYTIDIGIDVTKCYEKYLLLLRRLRRILIIANIQNNILVQTGNEMIIYITFFFY